MNLSGGQKQRVGFFCCLSSKHMLISCVQINMARALYYDAEVVVLDDPLSAG